MQILQFLLPPKSLMPSIPFFTPRILYRMVWPNETTHNCTQLKHLLDNGNNQIDTLVVMAHHAYNHIGLVGWASQMCKMNATLTFGISFMCAIFLLANDTVSHCHISADKDVAFEHCCTLYGRYSLDYIVAISNWSLQAFSMYLTACDSQDK